MRTSHFVILIILFVCVFKRLDCNSYDRDYVILHEVFLLFFSSNSHGSETVWRESFQHILFISSNKLVTLKIHGGARWQHLRAAFHCILDADLFFLSKKTWWRKQFWVFFHPWSHVVSGRIYDTHASIEKKNHVSKPIEIFEFKRGMNA